MNKETLKPFDLTEALEKPQNVRLDDGTTPTDWHYFETIKNAPIHVEMFGYIETFPVGGGVDKRCSHKLMLVDETPIYERFVNIFPDAHAGSSSSSLIGCTNKGDGALAVMKIFVQGERIKFEIVHTY